MQSSGIYNRIKLILAAGIAIVLSACSREGVPDTGDVSYTIISGGTAVTTEAPTETEDIYADVSDTKLYIPEHMVTKYASLDYDKRMQDVYDDVVDTMQNFRTKSYVPLTISTEDYVKVLETVRCEQLMLFYLQNRYLSLIHISEPTRR